MKNVEESWDVREKWSRAVQLEGRRGGGRVLDLKKKKKLDKIDKVGNQEGRCSLYTSQSDFTHKEQNQEDNQDLTVHDQSHRRTTQ